MRHSGEVIDVPLKPEIDHFSAHGVVFVDGSIWDTDVVVLATGYEQRKAFLEAGGELLVDRSVRNGSTTAQQLYTNLKYIFPLYRHIFSLGAAYPSNALAFLGLPTRIANCPSDIAQSLLVAHAIFNASILPSREEMLQDLGQNEAHIRSLGYDPYTIGHEMVGTAPIDYQDELIDFLRSKASVFVLAEAQKLTEIQGALPTDRSKYVEQWRRDVYTYKYIRDAWKLIEKSGDGPKWTRDAHSEEDWADVMRRVDDWGRVHTRD